MGGGYRKHEWGWEIARVRVRVSRRVIERERRGMERGRDMPIMIQGTIIYLLSSCVVLLEPRASSKPTKRDTVFNASVLYLT